jgi:sulfatase modifying factor 1
MVFLSAQKRLDLHPRSHFPGYAEAKTHSSAGRTAMMRLPAFPGRPAQPGSGALSASSATQHDWIRFDHVNGHGISAARRFARGEVIERAPVLLVPGDQWADLERTFLPGYCCQWGEGQALALGFAPFYSHSDVPNAVLVKRIEALIIEVAALRDIEAGEEISVDGGAGGAPFWFEPDETTLEGLIYPVEGSRDRWAREMACQGAERQALAQAAERARLAERSPRPPLHTMSLLLAPGVALELVPVPSGVFVIGGQIQDVELCAIEKPEHKRYLDDFWMARYPVTVRQFAAFVDATGHRTMAEQEGSGWVHTEARWRDIRGADWLHPWGPQSDVRDKADHPVTLVSWDDAVSFCRWASQVTGYRVGLPSELEWEKAARGTDGRPWPWGEEPPDATRCNYRNHVGDTTLVGHHSPRGDSPYHCADMAGNVWEWTASYLRIYPFEDDERRGGPTGFILRGGAFHQDRKWMRCAGRYWYTRQDRLNCCGFRVRVLPEEDGRVSR